MSRMPRVALLGSMANNLYNACCNLRGLGVDAVYFLDGADSFAMGQPIWEESPLRQTTEDLYGMRRSFDEWLALTTPCIPDDGRLCVLRQNADGSLRDGAETDRGRVYAFRGRMEDGLSPERILHNARELGAGLEPELAEEVMRLTRQGIHLIQALSTFDVIVASKYWECLWACLTGKPVRYIVYGADWRYVLANKDGLYPNESKIFEHILKRGNSVQGVFNWEDIMQVCFRHGLGASWLHCAEPFINTGNALQPRDKRSLRQELGLPADAFILFLPSRVDAHIKKTDLLLRAFSRFVQEAPEAMLVTAGWGSDLERMAQTFPLKHIHFLDHVMSKPLLFDFMCAADIVADQFADGAIGSTGREALAAGRPLLAFVSSCFQWSWSAPSPILNAASEEDILRWLRFARANPQPMEQRGAQSRQWLLANMKTESFARELQLLGEYGAEQALSYAPTARTAILDHEMECPRGDCSLQVARWPWPYTAGLSISNDCEYYTWEHFCALHQFMGNKDAPTPWGRGLGLPFSDSFWFYDDGQSGFSWFQGDSFTPSVHAPFMEKLVQAGFLDTIHAWGGFDAMGGFRREHALRAAACLEGLERRPEIFTNHGSSKNYQNVGGRFAQEYHRGDLPDAPQYHADILHTLGVRWFWSDEGCTNQFSLLSDTAPPADDGICRPDTHPWSGQLLYRNRLRDGRHVHSFRRMRGAFPKAPTASTLARQITPQYLDQLETARGGACVYQHLGCWRDEDGKPRPFEGQPFPPEGLRVLEDLAARHHAGRIWVAPLRTFLRYTHAVQNVVVEPHAHEDWLELKLWFLSGDLAHEDDLCGLSLLLRATRPVKRVSFRDAGGHWHKASPLVSTLDDGRQLVRWPWPDLGDFPFTGKECR